MLQDYAHQVAAWLNFHPEWAGIITFIVAFAESLAIVGIFVPALVFFTAIGALLSADVLPLVPILLWAFAGAVVGDGISYIIGYYYQEKLQTMWPFQRYQTLFDRAREFFLKHGGKSIFICRFIGPFRAVMPMIAGIMNMKPTRFFFVMIPAAALWSPIYMSGGYIAGFVADSISPHHGPHLTIVISLALLIIMVGFLILRWLLSLTNRHLHVHMMRFKPLEKLFFDAIDFNHARQTFFGLWSLVFSIAFFALLLLMINQVGLSYVNNIVHHFFQTDRYLLGDKIFLAISLLGAPPILFGWVIVIIASLIIKQHVRTAKHTTLLVFTTSAIIYFLKTLTHITAPDSLNLGAYDISFPSIEITMSLVLYGFLGYLIVAQFAKRYHYLALVISSVIVFLIAVSRLYFGGLWLSDVIGSALLGLVLTLMFIISYRRKPAAQINLHWFLPLLLLSLLAVYGLYAWQHYIPLLHSYQSTEPQHIVVLFPTPVLV